MAHCLRDGHSFNWDIARWLGIGLFISLGLTSHTAPVIKHRFGVHFRSQPDRPGPIPASSRVVRRGYPTTGHALKTSLGTPESSVRSWNSQNVQP